MTKMKFAAFRKMLEMTFDTLIAHGTVAVQGGDRKIPFGKTERRKFVEAALEVDDCTVYDARGYWIRFIWFNDPDDCLSDYHLRLEKLVEPIQAVGEQIAEGKFRIELDDED